MFDEKGYLACSLNRSRVKNTNDTNRARPISDVCMYSTAYTVLIESKFYNRSHGVFTLFCIKFHSTERVFHSLRDCITHIFPRFVLLNNLCSDGSRPRGWLFVHVFNLILLVAIWCEVHSQNGYWFICINTSEGDNVIWFISSIQNFVLSRVCAFPFPLSQFLINHVPCHFIQY